MDLADKIAWWHFIVILIYTGLLLKVMLEPVHELKELSKEDIDDMAIDNVEIDNDSEVENVDKYTRMK